MPMSLIHMKTTLQETREEPGEKLSHQSLGSVWEQTCGL